jgi:structural maintenance of chromosome 1
LSKKLITDNEKQCSKQEDGIRALVAELADLDRAWKSFEKQMEEKILQKGRDIELENSQVKKNENTGNIFYCFSFKLEKK